MTTTTLAVCVDCLMLIANGEVQDGDGNDITEAHAAKVETVWGNTEITLGTTEDDEDECDEGYFSWSSCDGCNSHLGGDRFGATAWTE